jgi:hypothetical protein
MPSVTNECLVPHRHRRDGACHVHTMLRARACSPPRVLRDSRGFILDGGTYDPLFRLPEHLPNDTCPLLLQGSVFTAGLAWFMLGNPASHYSWRAFAAVASSPSFICLWLTYRYVPESAQYLARNRLFSDAEEVVNHIRTVNRNGGIGFLTSATEETSLLSPYRSPAASSSIEDSSHESHHLEVVTPTDPRRRSVAQSFALLFDPVLRLTTVSLFLSWSCLSFGSYGIATWITVLFQRINLSDPFANAFIYAAANLPGNVFRFVQISLHSTPTHGLRCD